MIEGVRAAEPIHLNSKYVLRSHLDTIRGLHFIPNFDALASISEDCTVKLWSVKSFDNEDIEPYQTLRGHTS